MILYCPNLFIFCSYFVLSDYAPSEYAPEDSYNRQVEDSYYRQAENAYYRQANQQAQYTVSPAAAQHGVMFFKNDVSN